MRSATTGRVGIIASKSVKGADEQRTPRFDLYRRGDSALGVRVAGAVTEAELFVELDAEL